MTIDIAIVNYRSAADTLQALARLAPWPHGTLWLVDNSAHEPDMAAETAALQQAVSSWQTTACVIASDARQSMPPEAMDCHATLAMTKKIQPRDDEDPSLRLPRHFVPRNDGQRGNPCSTDQPGVKLLAPGSNLGFGRACNLAFAESKAEFFLLLNPDARISAEDVLALAHTLSEQPKLAAVSPKIYWNDQRSFVLPAAFAQTPWYHVAQALATRSRALAQWAARRGVIRAMRQMAGSKVFEVTFLAGSVLLLRRSAILQAGGLFDPDYFMFYEDSDLSLRLRRAGFALAIAPTACAVHEYRHKTFKAGLMAQSEQQYFSKQYPLFYRWSGKLSRIPRLAGTVRLNEWFKVLPGPLASAEDFTRQTGRAGVLACSPTLLLMPAMFRASLAEARPFDDAEWALLEPGAYTALLVATAAAPIWVYFLKE